MDLHDHLTALATHGGALGEAAGRAGLTAAVPTCPEWDVAALVRHQGMVHRWAAATLRGDTGHDPEATEAAAVHEPDLLAWYAGGLAALLDTLAATPDDAPALVFLNDAPAPRRFWARRQAHETTIHAVDALSATYGRWPRADEVDLRPALAADGIDELLTGFITRGAGKLHADPAYQLLIRAEDTGDAWTVRVSDGPIRTTRGATGRPDATFTGSAAQLYLSLWNRADEITAGGPAQILADWRAHIRIQWS
jgi:uncharacterized protein (TIGR03083 family)